MLVFCQITSLLLCYPHSYSTKRIVRLESLFFIQKCCLFSKDSLSLQAEGSWWKQILSRMFPHVLKVKMELGWNLCYSPCPAIAGCAQCKVACSWAPPGHTHLAAVPGLHILWGLPGVLWSAQSCARGGILGALMEDLLGNHGVMKLQLPEAAWCSLSMINQASLVSIRAGTCAPQLAQTSVHLPGCHCSGKLQRDPDKAPPAPWKQILAAFSVWH